MMRVLLGSGGFRTPERVTLLRDEARTLFGAGSTILFVPWALADHEGYTRGMQERFFEGVATLVGLHTFSDPVRAVEEAEGVFVGGGNTFRLTDRLHRSGVMEALRRRVGDGMPYMGVSAGSNVACPTMMTTNDMPIVRPPSFETLGLVPFQINPHYFSGQVYVRAGEAYVEHFGETRDERIAEYHEENSRTVVGLWEGAFLRREGMALSLIGGGARIVRRGQEARDVTGGSRVDELLSESLD